MMVANNTVSSKLPERLQSQDDAEGRGRDSSQSSIERYNPNVGFWRPFLWGVWTADHGATAKRILFGPLPVACGPCCEATAA